MAFIQCMDCGYWIREPNSMMGQCRRKSPSPTVEKGGGGGPSSFVAPFNYRTIWPFTREIDGCGDGKSGTMQASNEMRDQTFDGAVSAAARRIKQ